MSPEDHPSQQYPPGQRYPRNQPNRPFAAPQQHDFNRQHQQQYPYQGPEPGAGEPPNAPQRSTLIVIFAGLGVAALLVGAGAAQVFGNSGGASQASLRAAATPTTGSIVQQSVAASTDPADDATSAPATTAATTAAATRPPNYRPIGANPAAEKDLDFGFLTKVTNTAGQVSLRFDRANFYTGEAAKQHNKGVVPDDDYLIENTNPTLRTFALDPSASIIAANRLLSDPTDAGPQNLTADELVDNSQTALAGSTTGVPVWLRHTDGLTGPVTALSEQYLP
jgi:septal ring-binding cell division protein DamX